MVERMGAIRYVLGYRFNDEELLATLTRAYLNATRIDGSHQLASPATASSPTPSPGDRVGADEPVVRSLEDSVPHPRNVAPC